MNKKIIVLVLFFLLNQCSFNAKSKFWNPINIKQDDNKKELFRKAVVSNFEINEDLEINIQNVKFSKSSFKNNLTNNNGRLDYDGKFKKAQKFKFSKIRKFGEYEPEIAIDKNSLIFFSNKGSILKFNDKSELIWKKNYYSKQEKKLKPNLFLAKDDKTLIVADNVAKIYALDINTGELKWQKNNTSAFNSEIKIYKDHFFLIDYQNILRCFSVKDGKEIWKMKTENSILKSEKKLSLVIKDNKIFFNNSIGDIIASDVATGNLLWIVPTLKDKDSSKSYILKISNLVINNESVYFSTNRNEFYSIDINSGIVNWKQNVNSSIKSTIVDNFIFSVTDDGYFVILNTLTGAVIRKTDIFSGIKEKEHLHEATLETMAFYFAKVVPSHSIMPKTI